MIDRVSAFPNHLCCVVRPCDQVASPSDRKEGLDMHSSSGPRCREKGEGNEGRVKVFSATVAVERSADSGLASKSSGRVLRDRPISKVSCRDQHENSSSF